MLKLNHDVTLIKINQAHASNTFNWVKSVAVRQNIGLQTEPSLEKTIKWIEKTNKSQEIYAFAILSGGVHVGNVILDRADKYLSMARFSIYIGETNLYNVGIGSTATYKICKFGFEDLKLNKIWLTVHAKNFRAINSYIKVGFRLEGVLRDEFLLNNQRIDAFYMGQLHSDFTNIEISYT